MNGKAGIVKSVISALVASVAREEKKLAGVEENSSASAKEIANLPKFPVKHSQGDNLADKTVNTADKAVNTDYY